MKNTFFLLHVGILLLIALSQVFCPQHSLAQAVNYDIVYIRYPRAGDTTHIDMPEVSNPITVVQGSDLVLLHPNGSEEVLVAGGNGAVIDPYVSFDGNWVYYAKFHDLRSSAMNSQRGPSSRAGADIFKINLQTRQIIQLTFQEWTPNTGVVNWSSNHLSASPSGSYYLGYGIFNLGPCPLPNGKIIFTSSRNGFRSNKSFTFPNLQLYVMDEDGKNVELVGHLNLGSALHPTILKDGRVLFSSYEAQGVRDERLWGLWAIYPDGRNWEPVMSAFADAQAFHFQGQLSNGNIAFTDYYNLNNNGFGTVLGVPPAPPATGAPFGSPTISDSSNPQIRRGIWWFSVGHPSHKQPRYKQYPFSPKGLYAISGFTHGEDDAASRDLNGGWAGKVTHPSGAPNNDLLLTWSSGPANDLDRPTHLPEYDAGLYLVRGGGAINDHTQLVLIKNSSTYNELQPRAVVPYQAIYGVAAPASLPWLPNDGTLSPHLPKGTPFGLVGTSSFYKRNTTPGQGSSRYSGLDPFNTAENGASPNWLTQGADAGRYANSDIWAVRILSMEPTSDTSYGPISGDYGYYNHANERLRILGEIPLRKKDAQGNTILDPDGNPDTSFLAKIPADVPFTFQTLDRNGLVLNMSQTWHQVRPGEVRNNCGGCHAHAQVGTNFAQTAAARSDYQVWDVTQNTPLISKDASGNPNIVTASSRAVDVEYYRDIKPILQRSCVGCHSVGGRQDAGLALDDTTLVNGIENTYHRLANDQDATYGYKPVIGSWRQTNASRYVRKFQARRSLLAWKVFGARLDGWTNADHPTESTPGNAGTLPAGANASDADLDFVGTIMPPPNSGFAPLTEDEKIKIARWIDLGAPVSKPGTEISKFGWFADDLRPTLTVSSPRAGTNSSAISEILIGMYDYYSGLNASTLSVTASFPVNGRAAGAQLADLFSQSGDHIWRLGLSASLTNLSNASLTVSVRDTRGNITTVTRTFSVQSGVQPSPTPSASPSPSPRPSATSTPSASPSPSATPRPSVSATPSRSPVPSSTPSARPSASPSASRTATPSPSRSASPTPSASVVPSASRTATPSPSRSLSPTPSASVAPSASRTPSPSPSRTALPTPTASSTASPSRTPTASPSRTASPSPTRALLPSATPSASPSPRASATPTRSPALPSATPTASPDRLAPAAPLNLRQVS